MKMNKKEGDYGQILKNGRTCRRNSGNSGKACWINPVMRPGASNYVDIHAYEFCLQLLR